jgi:predicted GNAT superfamily acetyltransferase
MKDYLFSPISSNFIAQCHELNEKNVPNVGTKSFDGFINLVENSDYNECILKNNKVVGYVVCFQDNENTINYMHEIKHKNFMEIENRVSNFLYIDRVAVDNELRKNKLGSSLYENTLNFAKENSIKHLTAEINLLPSKNEASFKFHKSFGFNEIQAIKHSEDYEVSLQKLSINS